jgi:hypothetical protein
MNLLESCDTITFRIDYTPPVILTYSPAAGATLDDIRPTICVDVFDSLSGVNPSTLFMVVDGTPYSYGNPALTWDGARRLCWNPATAGITFRGGDTVCVRITADDRPDLCSPHTVDSSWCFMISPGGPVPAITRPEPGAVSACNDEYVSMTINDPQGIRDTTIVLRVTRRAGTAAESSSDYTTASSALTFTYPDLRFTPTPAFEDGESIHVCLNAVEDSLFNPLAAPLCWGFSMDLSAPVYSNPVPAPGSVLLVRSNPISIDLTDIYTGIEPTSILLTFRNVTAGTPELSFRVGDAGILYDSLAGTLSLSVIDAGINWTGGDSICLHVQSFDRPSSIETGFSLDYCPPNSSEFDWCFTVAPGGPTAQIVRPLPGTWSSCVDEHVELYLRDDDVGVDITTLIVEVNGTRYLWGDTRLSYNATDQFLIYTPDPPFADGQTYRFVVVYAADLLGNESHNLLDWTFNIDMTPPDYTVNDPVIPIDGIMFMTRDKYQPIVITVHDRGSGLTQESVRLVVNDTLIYGTDDFQWNYEASTNTGILRFLPRANDMMWLSGDTVRFTVSANDSVYYCADNASNASYSFLIEPEVSCLEHPNPFTPNSDNYNDIAVFDWPYMFTEGAKIQIFDRRKQLVFERDVEPISQPTEFIRRSWDGRDNKGQLCLPGIYLYLVTKKGEVICEGTITLVR